MEQATVKAFFTGEADKLLDDNMYKLAESQYFAKGLARHLKKLSAFTVPIALFVKQQAEKVVASEANFDKT